MYSHSSHIHHLLPPAIQATIATMVDQVLARLFRDLDEDKVQTGLCACVRVCVLWFCDHFTTSLNTMQPNLM